MIPPVADTVDLHAHREGEGPPVVLLHGLFGSWQNLGSLQRAVAAAGYTAWGLDLRNHGRSPHHERHDYPALAADVAAWMAATLDGPCPVIGHSMGGKTAMTLALAHPGRVSKLAVLDIAPRVNPRGHDEILAGLNALTGSAADRRAEVDRALARWVPEDAVRSFLIKNLHLDAGRVGWKINLDALTARYDDIAGWPQTDARFDGPVLFVAGGASDYVRETDREAVLRHFPAARLKQVAGAGHWLHAEKPAVVAKLLLDFLRG